MVFTKVGAEHDVLHVTYYETALSRQGIVDLTIDDSNEVSKIHEDDTVEIVGLSECVPGDEVTVVVHHPDDTIDEIAAHCA